MKGIYGAIGVIWLCSLIAWQQVWVASVTSSIAANSAEITAQSPCTPHGEMSAPPMEARDSSDPRVDLLGNEIENAVADYRIDRGGDVYERHSPETAVPRLGSPTS